MKNIKLVENKRIKLSTVLKDFAPKYKHISIAAGYWDLAGTSEIIDSLMGYESIRLLIGQEPIADRRQIVNNLYQFPDDDFAFDLVRDSSDSNVEELRSTAKKVIDLIEKGVLQVKVYRNPRLHAKAYIFGQIGDDDSVGIVGSSNFTHAGLSVNAELNVIEDESIVVELEPKNITSPIGHLYWYNEMWNDPEAVVWTGDFSELIPKTCTLIQYKCMQEGSHEVIALLTDTTQIDKEIENLNDELVVISELLNKLIKENSRSSMTQDDYNKKFSELTNRYERTQEKHNVLIKARDNKKVQVLNLNAFIFNLKRVDDKLSEWNEPVWMLLVKSAVVHRDKSITFKLHNELEIRSK